MTTKAERSEMLAGGGSKSYVVGAAEGQAIWFTMIAADGPVNLAIRLDGDTLAEDSVYSEEYAGYWVEGKVFAPALGEIVFVLTKVGDGGTDFRFALEKME